MQSKIYDSFIQQERFKFCPEFPKNYHEFITPYQGYTNSEKFNFAGNFHQKATNVWVPENLDRVYPPLAIQPTQIYHETIAHLPHYTGHIPGSQFRCGKTYGTDTIDAKRWLRGDFTI